jgi:peptide/nickel transport system permease protein
MVAVRHILPNAAIPLISVSGIQFTYLLGGSIYIETIFAWPGLGNLLDEAIRARDFPLVQGITLFFASFAIVMHLFTDLAYGLLDPRIRHGGEA